MRYLWDGPDRRWSGFFGLVDRAHTKLRGVVAANCAGGANRAGGLVTAFFRRRLVVIGGVLALMLLLIYDPTGRQVLIRARPDGPPGAVDNPLSTT